MADTVATLLDAQYAGLWLQPRDDGWYVGLAGGPLTAAAARERLLDAAAADPDLTDDDVAFLAAHLGIDPQPYADAELRSVVDTVTARLESGGLAGAWDVVIDCTASDARRAELTLYADRSPELEAAARALLTEVGDRLRLVLSGVAPGEDPDPAAVVVAPPVGAGDPRAAVRVDAVLTAPIQRRCVHGARVTFRLRTTATGDVALATLGVGAHRRFAGPAALTRGVPLALRGPTTTVQVAVRLRDGRRASATYRFRRCAA